MKITKIAATFLASALLGALSMGSAFAYESCHKSKWGAGDQLGALNNITKDNILAATKLIKQGKKMAMAIETNSKTPAFPPRTYSMTIVKPGQENGQTLGNTKLSYHDDILQSWVGIGTQLDGLGHIGIDNTYYNCTPGIEVTGVSGLKKFGMETFPGVATRAVLLDMTALMGKDIIPEGTPFNQPEIEAALKRQGNMKINKGDVVIFYTGWHKLLGVDDKRNGAAHPGLGVQGARYLANLGVAMVGSDTWGLEVVPFEKEGQVFHVHQILLAEFGVFILENVVAQQAIKDGVFEGMITVGPHRTTGSVQAIVNPIFVYVEHLAFFLKRHNFQAPSVGTYHSNTQVSQVASALNAQARVGCTVALVIHAQQFVPAGIENHHIAFVDLHIALALQSSLDFRLVERCALRNDVFAHECCHV